MNRPTPMLRLATTLLAATLLSTACDSSGPQRETRLATTDDCQLRDAKGVVPVGESDALVAFARCTEGTRCRAAGPLMAESLVTLAIDVEQAKVPSHDYHYDTRDSAIVTLNGSAQAMRDGCSEHVLTQQGILTLQPGSTTLRLHADGQTAPGDALAELSLEVARPRRIELSSDGAADVQRIALRAGQRARIVSSVRGDDDAPLTTLGQELWWVDEPALVSLAPVLADRNADSGTDDGTAPPLQIRGVEIELQARAAGTTRLHVLALNVEHAIEILVEP